jgi:hypothetical protein
MEADRLKLRLLSVSRMKEEHPGLFGFARGRNLFVVSLVVLTEATAQGTVAHEIGHIQAARYAQRYVGRAPASLLRRRPR